MAVFYKPHKSKKSLLIGGQEFPGGGGGLLGPFPRYSVNREELSTGDGTYIGTKFSIDITGTATLNPNESQDITIKGERQTRVQGEALTALQFDREDFPTQGNGRLEIVPYNGGTNVISFNDARLISISLPEQTEESAGIQNLEYTFSFEAYKENSNNTNSTRTGGPPADPKYKLSSAEESWDLSVNEGDLFFKSNNPDSTLHKTYTLTHTLSATGLKKYNGSALFDDGEAWRQAQKWVKSRMKTNDNIKDAIDTDLMNDYEFWTTTFIPINMDGPPTEGESLTPDLNNSDPVYKGYNHARQVNSDLGAGTYGITETWLISANDVQATHSIETTVDDQQGAFITVSITATFQGLNTIAPNFTNVDNFDKAKTSYVDMKGRFYNHALVVYANSGADGALRNVEMTKSYGENKVSGTITYSVSYNDADIELAGAISEDITVNYDNEDGENKIIAKIPIIGRDAGPVIQDMGTTTIKIVSATLDAVMDRDNRAGKPDGTSVLNQYKPSSTSFQQSKTEAWNPKTGSYNLAINWEYN